MKPHSSEKQSFYFSFSVLKINLKDVSIYFIFSINSDSMFPCRSSMVQMHSSSETSQLASTNKSVLLDTSGYSEDDREAVNDQMRRLDCLGKYATCLQVICLQVL